MTGSDGLLNWHTSLEENTSQFVVESSLDGTHLTEAGTVHARNTPGTNSYSFTDRNIVSSGVQVVYYRLKMVDRDGHLTYSKIVALNISSKDPIVLLYPNPAHEKVVLSLSLQKDEAARVQLSNPAGQTVLVKTVLLTAGSNTMVLPLKQLVPGLYNLSIKGVSFTKQISFVKQ